PGQSNAFLRQTQPSPQRARLGRAAAWTGTVRHANMGERRGSIPTLPPGSSGARPRDPAHPRRRSMRRRGKVVLGAGLVALVVALWVGQSVVQARASTQAVEVPRFEVDPFWPKPLPNHWLLGMAIG